MRHGLKAFYTLLMQNNARLGGAHTHVDVRWGRTGEQQKKPVDFLKYLRLKKFGLHQNLF